MASVIKLSDNSTVLENVISTTYKECLNSGVDLRPGCVGSMMLEVEVYNTQANAVQAGDKIYYYQLDTAGTETLVGVFYAEPRIATKNSYRFVAYDAAQKLNADFSEWLRANQSLFPMTVKTLVQYACTVAGVTLGSTSWTTSGQSVQAFYADGITCRDIVSYAAELAGRYAHVHEDELLYFHWYSDTTNKRIYPESGTSGSETRYAYKQDGLKYANYTVPAIDGVAVHPSGEDDVSYIYPATPAGDNLLHIKNNLLLTGASAAFYNLVAQTVYTQMTAAALGTNGAYVPMTAQLFPRENPYEAGEAVDVTDSQGVSFRSIIMSRTITDAAVTLESTGNETQGEGGNTQKAITQLASDVVRINKLKVGYAEIARAVIDVLIANDITAQNLTIVDENGNVLATYDADGITLGQPGEAHAFFDFNSMELLTKNGLVFFFVGDMRGTDGLATLTELRFGALIAGQFTTGYIVKEVVRVTINGVATTNYTYSGSSNTVIINDSTAADDEIVVTYKTNQLALHYDIGTRTPGSITGAGSVVIGTNQTASGNYSTAGGGYTNSATGYCCVVCGGYTNTAGARFYATVCGGSNNTASGNYSFVGGGDTNSASATGSTVGGGGNNTASGSYSFVAGANNTASADFSTVFGRDNTATGQHQLVFGRYNNPVSARAEVVGNGTATTPSNARTLDWSGNEWLAGQINADTGNFRNGASSSGNIDITGGWFVRRLPAVPSAGTGYWLARITESNGSTGRGGVQFYRSSSSGDGLRISTSKTINGSTVSNILALYVDDNGNRAVGVSEQAPWREALSLAYMPGDSFTFGTGSYTIFAGAMRADKVFHFTIPLQKMIDPSVSTISVSGQVILVGVNTSAKYKVVTLNDPSSAPTDACNTTVINNNAAGITCRCEFAVSQSSWWTTQTSIAVQAYGLTVSFS